MNTGKLISAYYLEIEYLLERVEGATSHYQTLGVERTATNEEVITAYQKAVTVLHPSYHKVRASVPDEMLVRVDQAFKKVSQAFSVLTNSKQRRQYDVEKRSPRSYKTIPLELPDLSAPGTNGGEPKKKTSRSGSLKKAQTTKDNNSSKANKPANQEEAKTENPVSPTKTTSANNGHSAESPVTGDAAKAPVESLQINVASEMRPVFTKAGVQSATAERRRCERFKLTVPVLIAGYESNGGKWQEVTKTIDVSRIGVAVKMRRRVKHGLVVHITLPLPTKLRSHGFSEAGYNMYAIVRRVEPMIDGMRVVGLEFIGANPPGDYLYKPWATFRTQKWNGMDRRREPREKRSEGVAVEYLDETMQQLAREVGVTEDVSLNGARICVRSAPPEFEFVRVTSANRNFNSLALLRNQWSGTDGYERLCVQFIDQRWPM